MAAVPRLLTVRVSSGEWRIDGVAIHQPGYPIVSGDDEAGSSSSGSSSSADVTVCVQYVYGTGYTSRTLQEFAAWYLLLGAKRIVVFDSMEPSLEPTAEQPTAMERKEALHSLSVALGRRFVVVRGLAVWDMMRRTRSHMSGQSLAGNLCKSAAGALAHGSRPTFALMPDIDEYLTPPTSDADQPHRLATRLAGSLKRLAAHVHGGLSATSLYLNDPSTVASRVHHGGGTTRCLSFASIYYVLPACKDIEEDPARLGLSRPAILRRLWRGQPDNFEAGSSYNWTSFVHWNFFVRSKFLVDATDDNVLTANHECCCKPESRGKAQCSTRSGLTVNHTCATLEFMPLEHWHVRHFKGGGLGKDPMLCRHSVTMNAIQSIDGTRKHVTLQPMEVGFPLPWANEYLRRCAISRGGWAARMIVGTCSLFLWVNQLYSSRVYKPHPAFTNPCALPAPSQNSVSSLSLVHTCMARRVYSPPTPSTTATDHHTRVRMRLIMGASLSLSLSLRTADYHPRIDPHPINTHTKHP